MFFRKFLSCTLCTTALFLLPTLAQAYPLDGFKDTGIRRLARLEKLALADSGKNLSLPTGGKLPSSDIHLQLQGGIDEERVKLPPLSPELQRSLDDVFVGRDESYAVAVLDITPGRAPRFAARQPDRQYSPGSVGKLAIAAGLFAELQRLYPDSVDKRIELLKNRKITASSWIHTDHHDVPIYDPESETFTSRLIREGDVFSLYEWTDHMLSASANSAASTVWKELILMRHFGITYPPSPEEEKLFFSTFPKNQLRDISMSVVNDPLRNLGISQHEWQLGSLFTANGKKLVPSGGKSYANARAFITFLIGMEGGKIVDEWSSLELKKLLYMTAKRIRYASSPALSRAAVYFKSGSLYRCAKEEGFSCRKYHGNVENYMNSVAIVEQPDGRRYLAVLLSNVLRKNSAVDHQTMATYIDRIIPPPPPAEQKQP